MMRINLKENIKAKVDQLDHNDLRIIELLIESLKRKKRDQRKKLSHPNRSYLKVRKLMSPYFINSNDIFQERQDRI
ncbi:hypothetical protein ACFLSA_03190 [Bacteroidota bacterium]